MRLYTNDSTAPRALHSVRGSSFTTQPVMEFCQCCNRKLPGHRTDCPLHPSADMRDR